jgi:hypothetical protein
VGDALCHVFWDSCFIVLGAPVQSLDVDFVPRETERVGIFGKIFVSTFFHLIEHVGFLGECCVLQVQAVGSVPGDNVEVRRGSHCTRQQYSDMCRTLAKQDLARLATGVSLLVQ